eukprot:Tbor_TRINITY_DN5569_c3_g1::TRINITY_DN5569_c3_g1_i1::g.12721::m.12721/K00757/udp, UPP; uridine phosphorylase
MPTLSGAVDPELPIDITTGRVYHLSCSKADIADNIILVGDPDRVPIVSGFFDNNSIIYSNQHREIAIHTGTYKGIPISVISTGMGPDNIEIVLTEIHALKEFDVTTRKWEGDFDNNNNNIKIPRVNIIRVGTCGTPHLEAKVGDLCISRHVIGMDNTCRFYNLKTTPITQKLEKLINNEELGGIFHQTGGAYVTEAHREVTRSLSICANLLNLKRKCFVGITATGSGFYGCQGRRVGRFAKHVKIPDLITFLSSIRLEVPLDDDDDNDINNNNKENKEIEKVVNIEMETSALCALSNILGYKAGTICLIVAKRSGDEMEFLQPDQVGKGMGDAITVGLEALVRLSC